MKNTKVIVLYRVVQNWRAPVFERLSNKKSLDLEVWYGPDIKDTKLTTGTNGVFKKRKLFSLKLKLKSANGIIAMPISPFLFFKLVRKSPDVIISEGASNIINGLIGFIYAKIFRKKFFWWSLGKLQNRDYDSKRKRIDFIIQYIEKKSDGIITYSSIGKKYFLSLGIDSKKIHTAVNVVDTDSVLSGIQRNENRHTLQEELHKNFDFVVLFVGALIKEKSIDMLLHTQKELEYLNKNVLLLIVGDGPYMDNLKILSNKLALKNVQFVGNRQKDSYLYFSAADLFVLPGLGGLAISEAMCYSLPVICSIGDGCEYDLVTQENGIIDHQLDSGRLATYILDYISNPSILKQHGEKSEQIIREKYNIQNYVNVIENAISPKKSIS